MILLFKRLTVSAKSLVAWTKHLNQKVTWIPDKKECQPFDMLIDKKNDIKISGMGNILSFFCQENERDLIYWLSSLEKPVNGIQTEVMISRANKRKDCESLSNLIIVNLLEGTEASAKLEVDLEFYRAINAKVTKEVEQLLKKMVDRKPKKDTKKENKGSKSKLQPKKKKKEKPVVQPKPKKNQVDPEYLKQVESANLTRWNKDQKLETSSEKRNVLITSALPYVNNEPHLGNLIGAVLSADVFARYCRLSGYNIIYICGTDEYGTATEIKAIQEGLSPQEICDKYHAVHAAVYETMGIDFDYFGRTSTPKHEEIVQHFYKQSNKEGFIFEQSVEQKYCGSCDRYLADRYIKAKCPHCGSEAKGDQCDSCGKTLEVSDLLEASCVLCSTPVQIKDSNHLYLDLIKIKPELENFIKKSQETGFWTNNSTAITADWVKKGRARCITRDLSWGVPIPREGFEKKCFYVWFDAPIGYLSITANYTDQWRQWWMSNHEDHKDKNPVELYQFMGKDNVPFHTIFFPGSQLATREPWTYLKHINTTEYLQYEDSKFSKSNSTGVFGSHIKESNIPPEVWRFYLLSVRPEGSDTHFQWDDFQDRNNSELLANLGNFCNRVLKFIYSKNNKNIPLIDESALEEVDIKYLQEVWTETLNCLGLYEKVKLRSATRSAMKVSSLGNGFAQEAQVWGIKDDLKKRNNKLALLTMTIRLLAGLFEPIMPSWSAKVYFIMNFKRDQKEQELFAKIRQGGSWEVLKTLLTKDNLATEMNLPVPLFKKSKSRV
jgi:methionyl-tRNA synthetase